MKSNLSININWEEFLSRHDLIWDRLPEQWDESPFLGNGMMGAMIYKQHGVNAIRIDIGRSDVQDHRDDSYGTVGYSRPRLPIGYFLLKPTGTITGCSMRLDLWNAEATGSITTDQGCIEFRAIVHAEEMAVVIQIKPDAGEEGCFFQWQAAEAISPRQHYALVHDDKNRLMDQYIPNPPFELLREEETELCIQPLLVGGQTATAWREIRTGDWRTFISSTTHSWPETTAARLAIDTVNRLAGEDLELLFRTHREWWHHYYPISFLSISDTRLESFYWIQMYKLASATRADRAIIDDLGPWFAETPWPYATWNLNVQLNYWPLFASGRLSLAESLWKTIHRLHHNLINNVAEPYRHDSAGIGKDSVQDLIAGVDIPGTRTSGFLEAGNLTWALHDCWLYYRMTMDDEYLKEVLFPILKRSVNYYLHFLVLREDGKLHLLPTSSPEYGTVTEDCNYDLALLRWGCRTLLYCCDRLGMDDERSAKWTEVLELLTDYPEHESEGFMIGKGQRYDTSHRHYSHLLMIYPLYDIQPENPENRNRIEMSLKHWQSKPEFLEGYSCTGASSISSLLGNGSNALAYLNQLFKGFLTPNTMYKELGPVIETPLSAAQSIHDMLIQSWGGKIRVFPAVTEEWRDITIHDMRAEGGFLVSAVRKAGSLQMVKIKSLAGEPCRLRADLSRSPKVMADREISITYMDDGTMVIDLHKGEEVILISENNSYIPDIAACIPQSDGCNSFGLNARALSVKERPRNPQLG